MLARGQSGDAEEGANAVEEEEKKDHDGGGGEAEMADAETVNDDEDQNAGRDGRDGGDEQCLGRGHGVGTVGDEPGEQEDAECGESDEHGVSAEDPTAKAGGAGAEEVVAGEDGERGNGGQNVTGELGLGEGEEDDGYERPEDEELREGVAGLALGDEFGAAVADFPLDDGLADAVDEGAHGDDGPREGGE